MSNWFAQLWTLISNYPNAAATLFGVVGTITTGIFGWIMKHPLEKQAIAIKTFEAQIDGYDALVTSLQERISYYETREIIRDAYEANLIWRLRECEERHLRPPAGGYNHGNNLDC